ncbi:restriction endonuclease subunit S [Arhodomonas sp. AD133]|uniref:restriction endonuclease subunit S n=1 Tax=Arhodomonas sp. AD133 TaxID=3415009 RepID=UPI003EB7A1B9
MERIKWLFRLVKRQGVESRNVLSVYREHGVIEKSSRVDNYNKTPEDLSLYQLVNVDDLVINKMKAWQGSLGISGHKGVTSPDYVVYEPLHKECSRFIHHLLRSHNMPKVYGAISNGVRPSQWRLEASDFENIWLPLPPFSEQQQIVAEVESVLREIDALRTEAEQAVPIFQERRSALVSAAVTGKIDVRDWQPPSSEAFPEVAASEGATA